MVLQAGSVDRKNLGLSDLRRWLEPIVASPSSSSTTGSPGSTKMPRTRPKTLFGTRSHGLTPYLDEHPALRARVDEVAVAGSAAIERHLADERRQTALAEEQARRALRAEQDERDRAVAEAAQRVMAALSLDRIEAAERELADLTSLPGSEKAAAMVTRELATARQRAADAAATRRCEAARQLAAAGDLEGALAQLRAAAAHPIVDAEIASVELALRKRGEDRARSFESQRVKRDVERRADEAIAAADARFAAGERREALALLTDFRPRHQRVDERLEALSKEIAQLEAAEQADVARRGARVELERLEVERQELLRSADEARGRKEFAEAFALLDKLERAHARLREGRRTASPHPDRSENRCGRRTGKRRTPRSPATTRPNPSAPNVAAASSRGCRCRGADGCFGAVPDESASHADETGPANIGPAGRQAHATADQHGFCETCRTAGAPDRNGPEYRCRRRKWPCSPSTSVRGRASVFVRPLVARTRRRIRRSRPSSSACHRANTRCAARTGVSRNRSKSKCD